ncbi:hypothetical protein FE257_004793 [Aspergillus nanangensis]|uniref:NmrA-like domain-containing protein n=1 Tax=Aspergillus nanangensis TaxID=2582783 RepID=A0AAD4CR86_ASPNN|nr:hypothetical protein FE257_004793 [Aspergillus nanangensis]
MTHSNANQIAVVGGTGNLGSSVAISLHKNPSFQVRVLSRDANGPKAKRLSDLGITVMTANNWNPASLQRAFEGCWGVFINIDSDNPDEQWKAGKTPTELDMGQIALDCAVKAGVKHIVHASLPHASKLTNGAVPLISFDDKARVSQYMMGLAGAKKLETATVVNAGWFLENAFDPKYVQSFGGFAKQVDAEGFLTWKTPPMGNEPESVPWLAVADDYGDIVHGVFLEPERWDGKYVDAVSESQGFADLTATFQEVTGKKARFVPVLKGNLSAGNATKTKEVNGLFDLMHALDGCFFEGRATDHEASIVLKQRACEATRRSERLLSTEGFFRKYAL